MAIYRLGESRYKTLQYDQEIWEGKGGLLPYMMPELFPAAGRTSSNDRENLQWLYGKVVGGGRKGYIQVIYPYTTELVRSTHLFKNVNLHLIPFVVVQAIPEKGRTFLGWKGSGDGEYLSIEKNLIITGDNYQTITTFYAIFE